VRHFRRHPGLRNFKNVADFIRWCTPSRNNIKTLSKSTPINDHVFRRFSIARLPINKLQLVEVLNAFLNRRKPVTPAHGVCMECKRRGPFASWSRTARRVWVPLPWPGAAPFAPPTIAAATGALDQRKHPIPLSMSAGWTALGVTEPELMRAFRSFNAYAEAFRKESEAHER